MYGPLDIDEKRLLTTFLELLEIDSPSGDETQVIQHLERKLTRLGLETEIDAAGNLIGRLAGRGDPLLLCAHVDHVPPCIGITPIVEGDIIRSDGTTVLGGDDTSGVAIILELLELIASKREQIDEKPPALEIVFTVQEESGLLGSKGLDTSRLTARHGIVLDMGGPRGWIAAQGPSQNRLQAVVHGRKAHAACAPEEGINAIRVAAEAIAVEPLGRIDEQTTANVGIIHGGEATNIVPDRVEILGEARSLDGEGLRKQTEAMISALNEAAGRHGATVATDVEFSYRAFTVSEEAPIVQMLSRTTRSFGLEPALIPTVGGSDSNIFNERGIQTVNISTGMEQVHTTEEQIKLSEMVFCARLVAHLLDI